MATALSPNYWVVKGIMCCSLEADDLAVAANLLARADAKSPLEENIERNFHFTAHQCFPCIISQNSRSLHLLCPGDSACKQASKFKEKDLM